MAECQPQHQTPGQNADVIRVGQRLDRIGHQLHQQVPQHGRDATGRHLIGFLYPLEHQLRGKQKTQRHRHQGSRERAQQIQDEDRPDVGFRTPLMLRNGRHHQREHQHRCHRLQGAHEQVAQQLTRRKNPGRPALRNVSGTGHRGLPALGAPTQPARQQRHADRCRQPDGNPADQIEPSPRPDDSLSCHTKPLSVGILGRTRPAPGPGKPVPDTPFRPRARSARHTGRPIPPVLERNYFCTVLRVPGLCNPAFTELSWAGYPAESSLRQGIHRLGRSSKGSLSTVNADTCTSGPPRCSRRCL